MAYTINQCKS